MHHVVFYRKLIFVMSMTTLSHKKVLNLITLKDVAREADVSLSMASRALRGTGYIDQEKKEKILNIASKIGYIPNLAARSLRQDCSHIIGLMLMKGMGLLEYYMQQALLKYGYRLLVVYSNGERLKERECINTLLSSGVDGIICFFSNYENVDLIDQCRKNGVPVLQLFSEQYDGLNSIVIDDELMTYNLTRMMTEKGHRKILFLERKLLDEDEKANPVNGSYSGFCRAMSEVGIHVSYNDFYCLPIEDGIEEAIYSLLVEKKPTAVIGADAHISEMALVTMRKIGMNIGNNISFASYDDARWCEYLGITAYEHDHLKIGEKCAESVVNLISGKAISHIEKYVSVLHQRESVLTVSEQISCG